MKISEFPLFLDAASLRAGPKAAYILWNPSRCPHLLVVGATGSGKTYAVKLLLGKTQKYFPDTEVILCDYKHDDFRFLDDCPRYFWFERCAEGVDSFYRTFQKRQQGEDPSQR